MFRRKFLGTVLRFAGLAALARPAPAAAPQRTILLQNSPLAGFQYHAGEALWPMLAVGSPLALAREPDNRHDDRAVRVEWNGHKLGYVPAAENTAVAQLLDRGERLEARIVALKRDRRPWERVAMEIRLITDRTWTRLSRSDSVARYIARHRPPRRSFPAEENA